MLEQLTFALVYDYDTRKPGITVPAALRVAQDSIELNAKVDTGASLCIFERKHGERLGLEIEKGASQLIGTAMGSFLAYGHEVTLSVLGIETTATVYFAADDNFTRVVPWWERIAGTFADDPAFEKAMELGRQYRKSQRPRATKSRKV